MQTPPELRTLARDTGKLSRTQLKAIRDHLRASEATKPHDYAYMYAQDGDQLVELRTHGGRFTKTPVEANGKLLADRKRPVLLHPAWALTAIPIVAVVVELVT